MADSTEYTKHIGLIGLGRMGANLVRRLANAELQVSAYDVDSSVASSLANESPEFIMATSTIDELIDSLPSPRTIWLMVPAGHITNELAHELTQKLSPGDVIIDGGNSYYHDDLKHSELAAQKGINFLDVGTSGGVWGLERGYCLMIGGEKSAVDRLELVWDALAPGFQTAPRSPGLSGNPSSAERGWLHCGPSGAGHFVKMIHNGIEYGLMAAYAEGFNILQNANVGTRAGITDAETAPMENPNHYKYDFDLAAIAELWRRGSVVTSWLLDLTANSLHADPQLSEFSGKVSDSGEGRWTAIAAIDEGVPAPVLTAAVFSRFESRGNGAFAGKVLSAMRKQFGGHHEKK
jgi:6-phosphogluconate dehydrogenase